MARLHAAPCSRSDRAETLVFYDKKHQGLSLSNEMASSPVRQDIAVDCASKNLMTASIAPENHFCGATPNSSKKRRPMSALLRATPTPSHGAQMSMIFQDAAVSLGALHHPRTPSSAMRQKKRLQAQLTPFGRGNTPLSREARKAFQLESEPMRSPCQPPATPADLRGPLYPTPLPIRCDTTRSKPGPFAAIKSHGTETRSWYSLDDHVGTPCSESSESNLGRTPSNTTSFNIPSIASNMDSECHSSHGVPLVIPITESPLEKVEEIDNWLNDVSTKVFPGLKAQRQYPMSKKESTSASYDSIRLDQKVGKQLQAPIRKSRSSSNKENANPIYPNLSSTASLPPFSLPSQTPPTFIPPLPKRKRPQVTPLSHCTPAMNFPLEKQPTVHDDDQRMSVKPLSPDVQKYRKKRTPKRERCLSYWDTDIFQDGDGRVEEGEEALRTGGEAD